jgi:hypothetical protein
MAGATLGSCIALVLEGLEGRKSDFNPKDGKVTLAEWLSFGTDRVPKLDQEVKEGYFKELETANSRGARPKETAKEKSFQRPVLFNFAKRAGDPTILR